MRNTLPHPLPRSCPPVLCDNTRNTHGTRFLCVQGQQKPTPSHVSRIRNGSRVNRILRSGVLKIKDAIFLSRTTRHTRSRRKRKRVQMRISRLCGIPPRTSPSLLRFTVRVPERTSGLEVHFLFDFIRCKILSPSSLECGIWDNLCQPGDRRTVCSKFDGHNPKRLPARKCSCFYVKAKAGPGHESSCVGTPTSQGFYLFCG